MLLVVAIGCGGDDGAGTVTEPLCDATALADALGEAGSGDVVRVGACRIDGAFSVPAGVTLRGEGSDASEIVAPAGSTAITVRASSGTSRVEGLALANDGEAGLRAEGGGSLVLVDVEITTTRGIGLGVDSLASLEATNVRAIGPVTRATAGMLPTVPTPDMHATHGILVVGVGDATLGEVSASGFAHVGVELVESTTVWTGGGVHEVVGIGVYVAGGMATIDGVAVRDVIQGLDFASGIGIVQSDMAMVTTNGTSVTASDRVGVLQFGGAAHHRDLRAEMNIGPGIWAQQTDMLRVEGASTTFVGNQGAGILVRDGSGVQIRDARLDGTATVRIFAGGGMAETADIGDGVQLVGSTDGALLEGLRLLGNTRAGVLLDLQGGHLASGVCSGIQVDGSGTQLGVVMQNGTSDMGWDASVTRLGATAINDESFSTPLDVVGIIGPPDFPNPDMGVAGIIGPPD